MEILSLKDSNIRVCEKNNFLLIHHNDVKKLLELYSPDVFCATETWLAEGTSQKCYDVTGFNLECVNSVQDRGAGAAVYLRNDTNFHIMKSEATAGFEMICIFLSKISQW